MKLQPAASQGESLSLYLVQLSDKRRHQEVIVPGEERVRHITPPVTQTDNVIGAQIKQTRYDAVISEL